MKNKRKKFFIIAIIALCAVSLGFLYNKHRFTPEKWISAQGDERSDIIYDLELKLKIMQIVNGKISRRDIHNMLGEPMDSIGSSASSWDKKDLYYVGYMGLIKLDPYILEIYYQNDEVRWWELFQT